MSKYREALDKITDIERVNYPIRRVYADDCALIEEAIAKAEKYDEENELYKVAMITDSIEGAIQQIRIANEEDYLILDKHLKTMVLNEIKLTNERDEALNRIKELHNLINLLIDKKNKLIQENQVLRDGVKVLISKIELEEKKAKYLNAEIDEIVISARHTCVANIVANNYPNGDNYIKLKAMLEVVEE